MAESLPSKGEPDVKLNGELHRDHRRSLRCDELEAMLIYSMSVSVDGFIADREGAFGWTVPTRSSFVSTSRSTRARRLSVGRRLYETMLVWETIRRCATTRSGAAFADIWCAIPKVVFSRTLDGVQGNALVLAEGRWPRGGRGGARGERQACLDRRAVAAAAIELRLVDELRMFRNPVVVGGGTPFLPPVSEDVRLDLVETRTFGSRVIYERYGRARRESD